MSQEERDHAAQAALVGGLFTGFASVIPVIQAGNLCCGMWGILGGLLTAKLLINRRQPPIQLNEVLRCAASAGLLAGVIRVFLGLPLEVAMLPRLLPWLERAAASLQNERLRAEVLRNAEQLQNQSTMQTILALLPGVIFWAVLLGLITTLGGVLGYHLFGKAKNATFRPPPPSLD